MILKGPTTLFKRSIMIPLTVADYASRLVHQSHSRISNNTTASSVIGRLYGIVSWLEEGEVQDAALW